MPARIGVVTFPGSLDDRRRAARRRGSPALSPSALARRRDLHGVDAVVLPGGFSYGDYLRCGAIARFAPVMEPSSTAPATACRSSGICNGFQVLCESHLLPGALIAQRPPALRLPRPAAAHRVDVDGLDQRLRGRAGDRRPAQERRGRVRRRRAHPRRARGRGPRRRALRRRQPERLAPRHRRHQQRRRQRRRPDAAPRARRRGADRARRTDGLTFFTSVLQERWSGSAREHEHRHRQGRGGDAGGRAAVRRARAEARRVRPDPGDPRPPADVVASWRCTRSCGASTAPTRARRCTCGSSARRSAADADALLVGIGENAGVVDVGQGYAVTFKVESHNHPSYVEPYQGAATGVGGIVRDILTMGARPVAVMDPLRFGPADAADTRRVLPGVVAGHRRLRQLPGPAQHRRRARLRPDLPRQPARQRALRRRHAARGHQAGQGLRARQPRHPVRRPHRRRRHRRGVASSPARPSTPTGRRKRPSVQVGDPFTEKVLIEAASRSSPRTSSSASRTSAAPGISCATSELASAGTGGMRVELDRVPLRDATLAPEEILMSESQERMCAIVEPGNVDALPRDLRQVGRRRDRDRRGHRRRPARDRVARRARSSRCRRAPSRTRARSTSARTPARPTRTRCRPTPTGRAAAAGAPATSCARRCCGWSPRPNLADKSLGHRPVRPLRAGQHRARAAGGLRHGPHRRGAPASGVALATDGNGRYAALDPYAGAQLALAEAYRNVAATGAHGRSP